jgi:hypothetical protein
MIILNEYRWKCDLCGAVSPPYESVNHIPNGWVTDEVESIDTYPGVVGAYIHEAPHHFCCDNHRQQWKKDHT